jgi:hypothetical protein
MRLSIVHFFSFSIYLLTSMLLLSTFFLESLKLCSSLTLRHHYYVHTKQQVELQICVRCYGV